MNVNFYTKNPIKGYALIYCVCTFNNQRISFSTKIRVEFKEWNFAKQRLSKSCAANSKLQRIYDICFSVYDELSNTGLISPERLKNDIVARVFGGNSNSLLVVPYYKKWAMTPRVDKKPSRQCDLSARIFKEYAGSDITFNDVDYKFIEKFLAYLQDKNLSVNYIGTQLKNLKAVMNAAFKEGLHNNMDYKKFKKMKEETDKTYLNDKEIELLENAVLVNKYEDQARDLFLIGYYTAMRYSDYSRLSMMNIKDGFLRFRTKKTNQDLMIPASQKLIKILEKNGGTAPTMTEWSFNHFIKTACMTAGIDDIICTHITKGGKQQEIWGCKSEFVSSHTARRSGLTNLYMSGVPMSLLKYVSGHQSDGALLSYLKMTREEMADKIKDVDFFK